MFESLFRFTVKAVLKTTIDYNGHAIDHHQTFIFKEENQLYQLKHFF